MPYDPESLSTADVNTNAKIFIYKLPATQSGSLNKGLYNVKDFTKFQDNIQYTPNGVTSEAAVINAIKLVHTPTNYEAKNYLIPSPASANNNLRTDSFGYPGGNLRIYAPLYGVGLPYESADDVLKQIREYLLGQRNSIEVYTSTLKEIAESYRNAEVQSSTGNAEDMYGAAANKINDETTTSPLTCGSMAGQFAYFFLGEKDSGVTDGTTADSKCPSSMWDSLKNLYTASTAGGGGQTTSLEVDFYKAEIGYKEGVDSLEKIKNYFSAYIPGPLTGGSSDISGEISNLFRDANGNSVSLRNYYSTKLISVRSLVAGQNGYWDKIQAIYSEGGADDLEGLNFQGGQANTLNLGSVTGVGLEEIFQ
jgi:hypothetical protein